MKARLAALLLAGLAACTPVGVAVGVGAAGGIAATQERGFGAAVDDARIRVEINHYWLQYSEELYRKVGLQVHEGRVLLTGVVKRPAMRVDAVRLAWQAEGVREVINEIEVAEADDLAGAARDGWIARRLGAKLTFDREIRSINYSAVAAGGVVYLIGVAQDEAELQRVIDHARDIPYVRRVVSHVRVKNAPAP